MDWAKTTARREEKHLCLGIGCALYERFYGTSAWRMTFPNNHQFDLNRQENMMKCSTFPATPQNSYGVLAFLKIFISGYNVMKMEQVMLIYVPQCITDAFTWLRPEQNGCHFADNIFKCIFFNKKITICSEGPIDDKSVFKFVQVMALCLTGEAILTKMHVTMVSISHNGLIIHLNEWQSRSMMLCVIQATKS